MSSLDSVCKSVGRHVMALISFFLPHDPFSPFPCPFRCPYPDPACLPSVIIIVIVIVSLNVIRHSSSYVIASRYPTKRWGCDTNQSNNQSLIERYFPHGPVPHTFETYQHQHPRGSLAFLPSHIIPGNSWGAAHGRRVCAYGGAGSIAAVRERYVGQLVLGNRGSYLHIHENQLYVVLF